jgi:hypothetical protein
MGLDEAAMRGFGITSYLRIENNQRHYICGFRANHTPGGFPV